MVIDTPLTETLATEAPTAQPSTETTPLCVQCRADLTWRDAAYVPQAARVLCKRCYQRHVAKVQGKGTFTPATVQQERGGKTVNVPIQNNHQQRRSSGVRNPARKLTTPWRPQVKRGMKTLKQINRVIRMVVA